LKRRDDSVFVVCSRGLPTQVEWRGQVYRVERILSRWIIQGHWWSTEVQRYYLSLLTEAGLFIVFHDQVGDRWYLASHHD